MTDGSTTHQASGGGRPLEPVSLPLDRLEPHYEAIVIGSGYGGAIAANRLARAGRKVALLERGREIMPGEFPATTGEAMSELDLVVGDDDLSSKPGLFDFHVSGDVNVLSGCGLGGTSLINANVSLRPDDAVLDDPLWPEALRADRRGLDLGYERARAILQPATYPPSYPPLAKVEALRRTAGELPVDLTPINVTFERGANAVGVHQEPCTGCGDCVTGCNVGAKNTLLMNYIPDAVAHGAEVFTSLDVRTIEKGDGNWIVHVQPLGAGRESYHAPLFAITADVVVLAAGTLGSTAILLRSAAAGLDLSGKLGHRFTGNGDVLGFAVRPGMDVRGVGAGKHPPDAEHPAGPCITAVVQIPDLDPEHNTMIIEDAVIPGALAPVVPLQLASQSLPAWLRGRKQTGPLALLLSIFSRGRIGMEEHLETFLVMGTDDDHGRILLDGGEAKVSWPRAGVSTFYEHANTALAEMSKKSGATYMHDPIWDRFFHNDLVTVHPLGGCAMADDAGAGVVDDRGRVFAAKSGTETYDGLYVWDGSVIPRPLGVNPLLTISALTERAVALLASDKGWEIDYEKSTGSEPGTAPPPPVSPGPEPSSAGLHFTERMSGYWSPSSEEPEDLEDYLQGSEAGEPEGRTMTFVLTIATDDVRAVTKSLSTAMTAAGTVAVPALSDEPLMVDGGTFQLLVADDTVDPTVRHMRYHLPLVATDGRRFHLEGYKVLRPGVITDAWPETTTLYVTLRAGGIDGPVVGLAVLHIAPMDFVRQLRTMQVTGTLGHIERMELKARFAEAFAGPLVKDFGTVIHRSSRLARDAPVRQHRPIDAPVPRIYPFVTDDHKQLRMTRYQGGKKGPVVLSHGMGSNPGLFTLDTIEPNLVEYLVAHGYDVWLQEWRGSTWLPVSSEQFNGDEVARFDFPAAEKVVREETGRHDVHWLCHCVAGISVSMAALAGTITPASIAVSQVAAHPIGPTLTELKARLHAAAVIRRFGVKLMTTDSYDVESFGARLFDFLLRFYPVPKIEQCDSAVCRRLAFIYGIAFHHPSLNEATHEAIHELFGVTDLTMMNHLANCAAAERVIANDGADIYLPHLDRLQLPFTFLHGAMNLVWVPESTERTYDLLVKEFGPKNYTRYLFADHGHGDCMVGAGAFRDVYPRVLEHLSKAGA